MHGPSPYETLDTGFATEWHYATDITQCQQVPNAKTIPI
jgi:hypothetical protein